MKRIDKEKFESVLKNRFFIAPAFSIYGGSSGLYDYGPVCAELESNILTFWKQFFVYEESLLLVKPTNITPHVVLLNSGHTARFSDCFVKDETTKEIFRADHYLRSWLRLELSKKPNEDYKRILAKINDTSVDGFRKLFSALPILSPKGNKLTEPAEINMMFGTKIGPVDGVSGFLRPETAQGQFVNFKRLLEFNNNKMPFGSASIGYAFRNEISPRASLLRVREFVMAEIEYFVHPETSTHPRFKEIKATEIPVLTKEMQQKGIQKHAVVEVEKAVSSGMVVNEIFGYFIARMILFLKQIGIDMSRVRARQHLDSERAHYSKECFDVEIECSYGWIECIGCADRGCYDLTKHSEGSKNNLSVVERIEATVEKKVVLEIQKKQIGKAFGKKTEEISNSLKQMNNEQLRNVKKLLEKTKAFTLKTADGGKYEIKADMLRIEEKDVKTTAKEYVPRVIEPSFGIGRIMYCLLEHSFWIRNEERVVFSFPPSIAPLKTVVLPLSSNSQTQCTAVAMIRRMFLSKGLTCNMDTSSTSIGKKYSRYDELGVPFAVTADFETEKDLKVTVRERDSMQQTRLEIERLTEFILKKIEETNP